MSSALIEYCAKAITPGWPRVSKTEKENARITARVVLEAAKLPKIGELIDFALERIDAGHNQEAFEALCMAREILLGEDME